MVQVHPGQQAVWLHSPAGTPTPHPLQNEESDAERGQAESSKGPVPTQEPAAVEPALEPPVFCTCADWLPPENSELGFQDASHRGPFLSS